MTPLHLAAAEDNRDAAALLLANKADIDAKTVKYGVTSVEIALRRGNKGMADFLVANHARLSIEDTFAGDYLDNFKLFLKDQPDLLSVEFGEDGRTALQMAAIDGANNIAHFLVSKGASVNPKDNDGWTPLHLAVINDQSEIAALLVANKADLNAKLVVGEPPPKPESLVELQAVAGSTPLHIAAVYDRKKILRILLDHKADVNATDGAGDTPLHVAANFGNVGIVKLLLEYGANVNAKDKDGHTPLHFGTGREEIAKLIREHGGHQ